MNVLQIERFGVVPDAIKAFLISYQLRLLVSCCPAFRAAL